MGTILVLQPKSDSLYLIKHLFKTCTSYVVEFASDPTHATSYLRHHSVDLVIIDTSYSNFAEYLLNYEPQLPILFLTPKGLRSFLEEKHFNVGHVTKPTLTEPITGYQFLNNVRSILNTYELRVAGLILDRRRYTLRRETTEHSVRLTATQCSVLYELMSCPNTDIAYTVLITRVWGEYAIWSEDHQNKSQDNLRQVVRQLRIVLKELGTLQVQIENVRGEGYIFKVTPIVKTTNQQK